MKLRTKLLVGGAVIPGSFLAAAIVLGGFLFERNLLDSLDQSLRAQAAVESVSVFDGGPEPHLHLPDPPLFGSDEMITASRAVYDSEGRRIVVAEGRLTAPLQLTPDELKVEPILRTRTDASGNRVRELIVPVRAPDGTRYALWLGHSTERIHATIRTYAETIGAAAAIALLFSIIQQVFFANQVTRRIRSLGEHMRRLTSGDLKSRPAPDDLADELGDLRGSIVSATEKLEEARLAQERLIADAAHELRTPLAAIQANIDITLRRERSVPQFRAACAEMREEVQRLNAMATSLLELARGRHAQWMMRRRELGPLLAETIEENRGAAEEKQVEVVLHAPEHAEATCDEEAIRQAFGNLLANAIKFSPPSSRVNVTATEDGDRWSIAFSDAGPGVPERQREAIFEPFRRLDASIPGTGLGLTIVRDIVQRHGGRVFVAPSAMGASFVVTLPKRPLAT